MSGEGNEPLHPPDGVDPSHYAASPPQSEPIYVTDLTPNDILLGRGAPIINYEGNVRFRDLVRTRKKEYVGTGRHQIKDDIARQIIEEIVRRKGRFLRKVNPHQENVSQLQLTGKEKVWRVAEEDVAIEKVKQALRDKEPLKPSQSEPPLADARVISGVSNSNNMNNAAAAMLWGDMAAAQGFAAAGLPNTTAPTMLANAPTSIWNPSNAAAAAAALNSSNNGGFNDVAAAAATMGIMQPSDQLALMLQQRHQDFMYQQQLKMLQSHLIRNQQFELLQRQQQQQQQQQHTESQQPPIETEGSSPGFDMASLHQHQQLLQQVSASPSGPAILAAIQASVGQQQQQNQQHMLQQQIQQQIQQLQLLQQQQQQQQQGPSNIQQNPQHLLQQQNQESSKAAVSESSDSHANNQASSSSSGTDEEEDNRDQKRKADASSNGSDKRLKSSEDETNTDPPEQRT